MSLFFAFSPEHCLTMQGKQSSGEARREARSCSGEQWDFRVSVLGTPALSPPVPFQNPLCLDWARPSPQEPGPGQGICSALLYFALHSHVDTFYICGWVWGKVWQESPFWTLWGSTGGFPLFLLILTLSYPYPTPCLCIDNFWVEFTFVEIDFRFQFAFPLCAFTI